MILGVSVQLQFLVQSVPVIWSSDIWSFRVFGQLSAGPDLPILIFFGYMVKFRIYGQFSRGV